MRHRFCPPPPGVAAASGGGSGARALAPFALDLAAGELLIRGAEEPYAIQNPTRFTGDVDTGDDGTGAISGVSFSTPRISFEQDITEPVVATVYIDADFAQVTPGSGTGSIDSEGNVLIQTALKVDLHIEVIGLVADCTATPINLTLESTSPYDPATGRVTLAAPDFRVPAAPTGGRCSALIADGVNEQLAGAGHAISFTLEGDIDLPPPPGCPTVSTLAASPADGSRLGRTVTIDATVAPDLAFAGTPECADVPTHPAGFAEIRDGSTVLATVPLVDGVASLDTPALPAGNRQLSVRYRGEPPFRPSTSATVPYRVTANPAVVSGLPEFLPVGVATPFDVEVVNSGLGFALHDARLDVTLARIDGTAGFTAPMFLLERRDGDTWVPVDLTSPATRRLVGSVGDPFSLLPSEDRTLSLRITPQPSTTTLPPGPIQVAFELVEVDPDTGLPAAAVAPAPAAVAAATTGTTVLAAQRATTTTGFRLPFLGPQIQAQVVRQGYVFHIHSVNLIGGTSGTVKTGTAQVLLDGRPIPARRGSTPSTPMADGYLAGVPLWGNGSVGSLNVALPQDITPGNHTVQVRYSGDANHLPSTSPTLPITVVPAYDPLFECRVPLGGFGGSARFTALVQVQANLPSHAPVGGEVPLGQFDLTLAYDRGPASSELNRVFGTTPQTAGQGTLAGIRLGLGPDGEGTATGLTRAGTLMVRPAVPSGTTEAEWDAQWRATENPDQTVTFTGESGSVTLDGAPGEVVPVTLDAINLDFNDGNVVSTFDCTPVGEPITLGRVTLAGTTLAVAPSSDVREGQEVTMTAAVAPLGVPGTVVFSDNGTTVGVVPVGADGTATTTFTAVAGTRTLRARFYGGPAALSTSAEQALTVRAVDCPETAQPGSAAVVRLVYLELLGRCPDPAGFAYWTGRLDDGTSAATFARSIARTPEAVGRVVDDAYQAMLGRPADSAGRAFWVRRLQAHGRYDQLLADLAGSTEFWSKAGATNGGFVARVYESLLARTPDQGGLDHWTGRLDAGTSRRSLVLTLATLDEPLGALVADAYDEILDRKPTGDERADGIALLRRTGDRSGLYATLIGTDELRQRAQDFPNAD